MSTALARFFAEEALALDGRCFDGRPFGREGGRVETCVAPETFGERVPVLIAGDCRLIARGEPPHAVVLEGTDHTVASRIDALPDVLLPKLRHIEAQVPEARQLVIDDAYDHARERLAPLVRVAELTFEDHGNWLTHHQSHVVGEVFNLMGICELHLGDESRAIELWHQAAPFTDAACRNLADRFVRHQDRASLDALLETRGAGLFGSSFAYVLTSRSIVALREGDVSTAREDAERLAKLGFPRDEVHAELLDRHPDEAKQLRAMLPHS